MKNNNNKEQHARSGFIMPRYRNYLKTWCVIVKDLPVLEFPKKKQASEWLKDHGYEVIY